MKSTAVLLLILLMGTAYGQVFEFPIESRTMVKTTDQSPVHWYLDIVNNAGVDTTLRWKTTFVNVPPEWTMNFDDQNNNYSPVMNGDSADFTLSGGLSIPQKLIIGAALNGTVGHGFTYFEVYDPQNPSEVGTIFYEFVISPGTNSIQEVETDDSWYTMENRTISVIDRKKGDVLEVYDLNGKLIGASNQNGVFILSDELPSGVFILVLKSESGWKTNRIILSN